jgi:quinol monooxygenase YgiN
VIRTYLQFEIREGRSLELIRLFKELRILETSVEESGCLSAELTLSKDGREAIVTATWHNARAYAGWTSREDRARYADRLRPLMVTRSDPSAVGARYWVAHSVSMPQDAGGSAT